MIMLMLLLFTFPGPEPTFESCNKRALGKVSGKQVWQLNQEVLLFVAGMSIDADGSPRAYHPHNIGLDYNANGRYKGNWVSVATVGDKPYVQKKNDPAPGYFVSQTSLHDPRKKIYDPARYVDAEQIPYIVLPRALVAKTKKKSQRGLPQLGDIALVINQKSGKQAYAILADLGPKNHLGEGSIALANSLGIPSSPKKGGIPRGITYIVFPGSGNGLPKTKQQINRKGRKLMRVWNHRLKACL